MRCRLAERTRQQTPSSGPASFAWISMLSPRTRCFKSGSRYSTEKKKLSQPVSRVLSRTVIHLQLVSPRASSSLPEPSASHTVGFLFGLAPDGVYLATSCYQSRGALLPHHFTLTCTSFEVTGGLFSVALAVDSHPPGVTWHPALWSPDFPLPITFYKVTGSNCPADSRTVYCSCPLPSSELASRRQRVS